MKSGIALLAALLVGACSDAPTATRLATKSPAPSFDVIAGSQLVTNGSFETPQIPATNSVPWSTFNSTGQGVSGWTIGSGAVDVQSGEPGAPFTNVPSGSQVLDLNNASISQNIATTAGVTYRVSFSLSENYAALHGSTVSVTVALGGTTQTFTFAGNSGESASNMRWDAHSFDVTATASSSTLQFSAGSGATGAGGPMLDNVQVASPSTYTSGSNVTAYDPLPGGVDTNWGTDVCTTQPAIALDDSRWVNPHPAYVVGGHPWAGNYFSAPWINAWSSIAEAPLRSLYPSAGFTIVPGSMNNDIYNWSKYTTTVSGQGSYVIQLLADNCSWIYLDNTLVGVQGTDLSKNTYAVNLNGSQTLTFLIFDGGGAAGGKFLLQTYQTYVANGGDPSFVLPQPVVNSAPVVAANVATVMVNAGSTATNTGTVSDPDNDAVTLTASVGTITNNGNGTWSWSLATVDAPNQSQPVTVTADDGQGHVVTTTFALAVTEVVPVVHATASTVTVNEGATASNTISASDADNDALTLTASVGTISNNGNGTWSWSYATTDGPSQSQTVTITAKDGHGHVVTTTFALVVNNVAPSVHAGSGATIESGESFTLNGTFTDAGADAPFTSTIDWGDGSHANGTSGSHMYLVPGNYTVKLTVTDKDGASGSSSVVVTVTEKLVGIDIKPGSDVNPINLGSGGVTPVAVYSTATFDASTLVASTVKFGPAGIAAGAHHSHFDDENGDGSTDYLGQFDTDVLGLTTSSTSACLTGMTTAGVYIKGCDHITVVPPKGKGKGN
jgi:hypothetical protein